MKAKLAELFAHDPLRLRELESAWVSTIHGFCARAAQRKRDRGGNRSAVHAFSMRANPKNSNTPA